jgi:hypothetical protein
VVGAWRTSTPTQRRQMESYQAGRPLHLSGKHRRIFLEESGISLKIIARAARPSHTDLSCCYGYWPM